MPINSGISTLGNRTFFFGGASGIDTTSLIKVAYDIRKREADKIDLRVERNTSKFDAFEKMRTMANDVKTSLANIKKNYSALTTNTGLFDGRSGTLSTTSATSPASLVTVAIDSGTAIGNFSLETIKKARVEKVGSNATFTDKNLALGYTGGFDIAIAGKTATTINVSATMSLSDLAAAINTQSATTGVNASVIQTTPTNFQLVLSGTDTAKSISITNVTGTDVMQSIGVTNGGGGFANPIQTAQQAEIKIDGISYLRDTNNFDGVIAGVKMTIKNAEPGTAIDLSIGNNNEGIKEGIQRFIETYNTLRDFIKSQQVVSTEGQVDSNAVLFGDGLLNNLNLSLQKTLGGSYGTGGPTALSSLGDVGIKIDANNKLTFDEAKFDTALIDKFDEVRAIFETKVTIDNPELRMTKNTSNTSSLSFAMQITMSGANISDVSVGGDNTLFDISGQTITGKVGTAYEGMTFVYIGTTNSTMNVDLKGGAADSLDTTLTKFADILTGDVTKEMNRLSAQNTDMQQKSARIIEKAESYRDRLIEKYANFETKLSAAQNVLAQLRALTGNKDNNN